MNELEKNAQLKKRLDELLKIAEEKRLQEENKLLEEKIKLLESQLGNNNPQSYIEDVLGPKAISPEIRSLFESLKEKPLVKKEGFPIPLAVNLATQTFQELVPVLLEGSISVNDPKILGDFEIQSIAKRLDTKSIKAVLNNSHGASRLQEIIVNDCLKSQATFVLKNNKHISIKWLNEFTCDNKRYDFEFSNDDYKSTPFTIDCKCITVITNNLLIPKDKLQDPARMADIYILHYLYLSDDNKTLHFKCRGWQDAKTLTWIINHKDQLSNPANELVFQFPEGLKIKPAILRDYME